MLAQNFKTAAELEIADADLSALVKVLGMLERGEIEDKRFDMEYWNGPTRKCGTAHCIGGWADAVAGVSLFKDCLSSKLRDLFYPPVAGYSASREQAAMALRNYLTLGEARWAEVMAHL